MSDANVYEGTGYSVKKHLATAVGGYSAHVYWHYAAGMYFWRVGPPYGGSAAGTARLKDEAWRQAEQWIANDVERIEPNLIPYGEIEG